MHYHRIIVLSLEQCQKMFLDHSSREMLTNQCHLKRFIIQNYNVLHMIYNGICRLQAGMDGGGFFSQGGARPKIYGVWWGRVLNMQGGADTNF